MSAKLPARRSTGNLAGWTSDPFHSLRQEMNELFSRFLPARDDVTSFGEGFPKFDVSETNGRIEVRVDVPGIDPDAIDVEVSGNVLTVGGQHEEGHEHEDDRKWHHVERRTQSFRRSITLPCDVRAEDVTAEVNNGVLAISLPKTEQATSRRIPVKK